MERIITLLQVRLRQLKKVGGRYQAPMTDDTPVVLQGVDHFKDIQYNRGARYGEMLMQQEYEMSCFNLDQADIGIHQQLYDLYERVSSLGGIVSRRSTNKEHAACQTVLQLQASCRKPTTCWRRSCPSLRTSTCSS